MLRVLHAPNLTVIHTMKKGPQETFFFGEKTLLRGCPFRS